MKTKKRIFLLAFSALIFGSVQTIRAQVTIGGETEPVAGATLDLSPENGYVGGLKLPNVELTSLIKIPTSFTDAGSVTATKLKGLQVYNTTTNTSAGLAEGVYIWNGNRWVQDGLKQNLIYNIALVSTAVDSETELRTFILPPGLYLWNVSILFQFTDTNAVHSFCSLILRNKTTGAFLAEVHNSTVSSSYMVIGGSYAFDIKETTTISLLAKPSRAGSVLVTPAQGNHRFCQLVKLN